MTLTLGLVSEWRKTFSSQPRDMEEILDLRLIQHDDLVG